MEDGGTCSGFSDASEFSDVSDVVIWYAVTRASDSYNLI